MCCGSALSNQLFHLSNFEQQIKMCVCVCLCACLCLPACTCALTPVCCSSSRLSGLKAQSSPRATLGHPGPPCITPSPSNELPDSCSPSVAPGPPPSLSSPPFPSSSSLPPLLPPVCQLIRVWGGSGGEGWEEQKAKEGGVQRPIWPAHYYTTPPSPLSFLPINLRLAF